MRSVRRLGLVLAAVCGVGVVVVSNAWALVSLFPLQPLFLSHAPGFFRNDVIAYECKSLKLLPPGDSTVSLRALSLLLVVDYEKCTIGPLLVLHFHPVRYLIDAAGLISLENDVFILGNGECVISWLASKNQALGRVNFSNNADGSLLLTASIKGVTTSGQGGPFPEKICEYPEQTNGLYTGKIRIALEGGVIRWDP